MATKGVLFDLDNTLYNYDSAPGVALGAVHREVKKHINISYPKFLELFKQSRDEVHKELDGTGASHNRTLYFQRMLEKIHEKLMPKIILRLSKVYWNTLLSEMKLNPNVEDVLQYCKKNNIKIAIVSDLTVDIQLKKIKTLKIEKYIDALVTSEEAGREKPHSIMFFLALNKLGLLPKEVIMVGDNRNTDIKGANSVGIPSVLFCRKKYNDKMKRKDILPNYTIKNMKEIIRIIEKINLEKEGSNKNNEEGYVKFKCNYRKTMPLPASKIKEIDVYRQKLYDTGLIGAYPDGVGYGNVSKKNGNIIITGTATGKSKKLNNKGYCKITRYNIKKNEVFCTGPVRASSESMTHLALYECSRNIGAVIHVHDMGIWKKYLNKLPTTPKEAAYGTPELADEIVKLYKQTDFRNKKIGIFGGHKEGLISFGKNLEEAYNIIINYFLKTYPNLKIKK